MDHEEITGVVILEKQNYREAMIMIAFQPSPALERAWMIAMIYKPVFFFLLFSCNFH